MKEAIHIPDLLTFNTNNFHLICDELGKNDTDLRMILKTYGYPPMWIRENSFETLVHIILEQQVSLASALAALKMLQAKTKKITPEAILKFSDEEMRKCYVSHQKTIYIRGLANAIVNHEINLVKLEALSNEEVRTQLIQLKGIGHWTIDVYLMFVLRRVNIFPIGDLAAVNAVKRLKNLNVLTGKEDILHTSSAWHPYKTVATMILWHFYLSNNSKKTSELQNKL